MFNQMNLISYARPDMIKRPWLYAFSAALITVLVLSGCQGITSTPIGKIIDDPRKYADKTVTVSGEVTEVFGFFMIKYFVIRDKTGEITVVTEKVLPKAGSTITVKGTVREAFALGDKQLLVIMEDMEGEKEGRKT